ncbi:hypothetical protein BC834DRAFT_976639 [Gloeopeniophorella convolvens]|nr:hypothetical protein BC834DRAFT_976639 [Gloeopeniophorella convolvens]
MSPILDQFKALSSNEQKLLIIARRLMEAFQQRQRNNTVPDQVLIGYIRAELGVALEIFGRESEFPNLDQLDLSKVIAKCIKHEINQKRGILATSEASELIGQDPAGTTWWLDGAEATQPVVTTEDLSDHDDVPEEPHKRRLSGHHQVPYIEVPRHHQGPAPPQIIVDNPSEPSEPEYDPQDEDFNVGDLEGEDEEAEEVGHAPTTSAKVLGKKWARSPTPDAWPGHTKTKGVLLKDYDPPDESDSSPLVSHPLSARPDWSCIITTSEPIDVDPSGSDLSTTLTPNVPFVAERPDWESRRELILAAPLSDSSLTPKPESRSAVTLGTALPFPPEDEHVEPLPFAQPELPPQVRGSLHWNERDGHFKLWSDGGTNRVYLRPDYVWVYLEEDENRDWYVSDNQVTYVLTPLEIQEYYNSLNPTEAIEATFEQLNEPLWEQQALHAFDAECIHDQDLESITTSLESI